MREPRMAAAAGRVRRELRRAAPPLYRAADSRIALLVQLARAGVPVVARLAVLRQIRARPARVAPRDVDVLLEGRVAELGEPEPVLLDEVDREAVAARRDRRAQRNGLSQRLARLHDLLERRAQAVPDDRVPPLVAPVVAEKETVLRAARAPRSSARVLHLDRRELERARLHGRSLERPPVRDEGTGSAHSVASVRAVTEPLLVRACRREPVERTPVWFMRQAGRSLPEYRDLRKRYGLFDIVAEPELCAEVTLQPVRRHDVDAAVMFTDIMFPVLGMGVEVELVENVGPVISSPIRARADVDRLVVPEPEESVPTILEAVRLVRAALRDDQAVIGFCGGPFTVAGYLIEGKPSREFATVKAMMYREPDTWHALMEKLADTFARYVAAKARAGADVIQVFDSWVGALSPSDYEEFVAPYSARVLAAVDVPTIHFGTGTATLLPAMADAGGDVIGLDWRIPLDRGWAEVGEDRGVQGNLDPAVLLAPWERIESETRAILARAGGRPGHVFNLGHGVPPNADPAVLRRLTEFVHEATVEARV